MYVAIDIHFTTSISTHYISQQGWWSVPALYSVNYQVSGSGRDI